jgi:NAD(P)-dependent dehydrogenase (short-subunit alcohol dehydrogenase family)
MCRRPLKCGGLGLAAPVAVVFGATGRTGREVVTALLDGGFDVVAAVRNASKADEVSNQA